MNANQEKDPRSKALAPRRQPPARASRTRRRALLLWPSSQACPKVQQACIVESLALTEWQDFGGGTKVGQISDFESQAHNFMHASYIKGPMGNASTAAQDPIYWFLHTYIDNVWDQWQQVHEADPCAPEHKLDLHSTGE